MKAARAALAVLAWCCAVDTALAGLADTPPQGIVILETRYGNTEVDGRYDGHGVLQNLADDVNRFAPTGEFQGKITVPGVHKAQYEITTLATGITDWLAFAMVWPFFWEQKTELNLGWTPGDFIPEFNRQMTGDDFWAWAGSLGQPKPPDWSDVDRTGDLLLATLVNVYREPWAQVTGFLFGNTFTGHKANPEILGNVGTSGFDFVTNGDIGFHLESDWRVPDSAIDRFTLSFDLFYEHYLPRTFTSPVGKYNPLIVDYAPYIGPTYKVIRGDIYGAGTTIRFDVFRGPEEPSWLTKTNPEFQKALPAVFGIQAAYTHLRAFDTKYESLSQVWDSEQEDDNKALYKHNFKFSGQLSLLRYGLPLDFVGGYMSQTLIPGHNFRPADGFDIGFRLYYSLLINPFDLIFGK